MSGSNYDFYVHPMSGNVGIYTSIPLYTLDIANTGRFQNMITNAVGVGTTYVSSNSFYVSSNCSASSYTLTSFGYINGTVQSVSTLTTPRSISGITFDGSTNISFSNLTLTPYSGSTSVYNGSSPITFTPFTASSTNSVNTVVLQDASKSFAISNIYAGNIGIGTSIPKKSVDIENGSINITGNLLINNTAGSAGQYVKTTGSGLILEPLSIFASSASNYILTNGTTFTIPTGCIMMYVQMWGGGGGGGSGDARKGDSGAYKGAGGGASGQYISFILSKSQWGNASTLNYTVGTGGVGDIGNKKAGTNGGNTTLTLNTKTITALGGKGGAGGSGTPDGIGGAGVAVTNTFLYTRYGDSLSGGSSISTGNAAPGSNAISSYSPGSGGAGGGVSGSAAFNGGSGGGSFQITSLITGGNAGLASNGSFANPTTGNKGGIGSNVVSTQLSSTYYSFGIGGSGGGGGGAIYTTGDGNVTAGTGGIGGTPGGGGGGGGTAESSKNSTDCTSGKGGNGGDGMIIITCL